MKTYAPTPSIGLTFCFAAMNETRIAFTGTTWDFGAHNARLYKEDDIHRKRVGAWCASKNKNQWLQVDLGKIKTVTAVATQGLSSLSSMIYIRYIKASWLVKLMRSLAHSKVLIYCDLNICATFFAKVDLTFHPYEVGLGGR